MRIVKKKNGIVLGQSGGYGYTLRDTDENGGKPEWFPTYAEGYYNFLNWVELKATEHIDEVCMG